MWYHGADVAYRRQSDWTRLQWAMHMQWANPFWVGGMLAWLCVWVKVQICIWPSWCHCHSLSLAPVNPDWIYLSGAGSAAHPGRPGQKPRKMVACMCVCSSHVHFLSTQRKLFQQAKIWLTQLIYLKANESNLSLSQLITCMPLVHGERNQSQEAATCITNRIHQHATYNI